MQIADSKTRKEFPLSPKKIWKKTVAASLAWVILLLVIYALIALVLMAADGALGSWLGGLISVAIFGFIFLIVLVNYLYQRWYFATYFYDLTEDYVVIKKGPITPQEITIPYERIQDVYVDQDLLDRLFGIYDVYVSSATISSGMEAHIDGLDKTATDGLRAVLLKTVSSRIGKRRTEVAA